MGLLVDGVWHDQWYDTKSSGGKFERAAAKFRNWVTPDGSVGSSGTGGFAAESGRYHLYVSYACPWAHRALIFRQLKGLADHISISAVHPDMLDDGWTFQTDGYGATGDTLFDLPFARDIYTRADPTFSGTSRFRSFGTNNKTPSSPTSPPRSSACSTAPSMR